MDPCCGNGAAGRAASRITLNKWLKLPPYAWIREERFLVPAPLLVRSFKVSVDNGASGPRSDDPQSGHD